jgi:arylsulfatase A-like enzyme
MEEHGHTLHCEVIHVPLIIAGPGVPGSAVVNSCVRTIDILPTILDAAGLWSLIPDDVEGASLLPVVAAPGQDLPVYSEGMLYGSTERSYIAERYKLMYDFQQDRYFLFDLNADPYELSDRIAHDPDRGDRMREALNAIHDRLQADFAARQQRENEAAPLPEDVADGIRALRSLGYVAD